MKRFSYRLREYPFDARHLKMNEIIHIKPHHFIDIVAAVGSGKISFEPHPYGHAQHTIAATIIGNLDLLLEIECGADDICQPCIHNIDGVCDDTIDTSYRPTAPSSKREWNLLIDLRWCERLQLKQGDRLTAREFLERLKSAERYIHDIYREVQGERTRHRSTHLQAGIKTLLPPPPFGSSLQSGFSP
ncbi:MAG: hypothetical protein C4527_03715 [Candidatus Omnitrophota bacterium]|nr:MAG: hypothetical protein C4527_03715 [Candidatus Omnitrophota bacterium]